MVAGAKAVAENGPCGGEDTGCESWNPNVYELSIPSLRALSVLGSLVPNRSSPLGVNAETGYRTEEVQVALVGGPLTTR